MYDSVDNTGYIFKVFTVSFAINMATGKGTLFTCKGTIWTSGFEKAPDLTFRQQLLQANHRITNNTDAVYVVYFIDR